MLIYEFSKRCLVPSPRATDVRGTGVNCCCEWFSHTPATNPVAFHGTGASALQVMREYLCHLMHLFPWSCSLWSSGTEKFKSPSVAEPSRGFAAEEPWWVTGVTGGGHTIEPVHCPRALKLQVSDRRRRGEGGVFSGRGGGGEGI